MRDYATISPRFWTGKTGRQIRAMGPDVLVVSIYLLSCPMSNMIGLYYLPIPTLSHETGIPFEGASKALQSLFEVGFCVYDRDEEMVWVYEMARHQIGTALVPKDNRWKGVVREVEANRKCRLMPLFVDKYSTMFNLPDFGFEVSPFEAPSKPLRSQEQEQEQKNPPMVPQPENAKPERQPRAPRSRVTKATEQKLTLEFPKAVVEFTTWALNIWPKRDPDGSREVSVNPAMTAERVDSIMRGNPSITVEVLKGAVEDYLGTKPAPKSWKAPQYFFGVQDAQGNPNAANWLPHARKAFTRLKAQAERAQAEAQGGAQ